MAFFCFVVVTILLIFVLSFEDSAPRDFPDLQPAERVYSKENNGYELLLEATRELEKLNSSTEISQAMKEFIIRGF